MGKENNGDAQPKGESRGKTLVTALLLCLASATLVSGTAVALHGLQVKNRENDRKKVILQVAGLYDESKTIEELFEQVEPKVVDLDSGEYVEDPAYDQRKAARDPEQSIAIPPDDDIAKIRRRAKLASVYLVKEKDEVKRVIVPIHGYGLWSTMYGYVALEDDANTIYGVQFYEQAETAGLGDRVTDPGWVGQFKGKRIYDEKGEAQIRTLKGGVDPSAPLAKYEVDAISGATITSNGVTNLMQYWFGTQGFEPYLKKLGS
ncbi:MAG: Na(+)-translocating NADH-quinone reductase subunit C [Myxococcota bacterium]|nr:Na(+)-translocating NADH-quinone reductase subunit C [Myxococcota bacterium]